MTLDTRVYVLDEVDRAEVFRRCQEILTQYDERHRTPEQQQSEDSDWGDHRVLMNAGMQGLPGWLIVHYRPEGQYRTEEQSAAHDHCDDECKGEGHAPACWVEVSIDTAYGYRGPGGMNCGSLHSRFVAELGMWLDERGLRWRWLNEYTGEIHEGYDQLAGLVGSSDQAVAWFNNEVKPAIAAHVVAQVKGGDL